MPVRRDLLERLEELARGVGRGTGTEDECRRLTEKLAEARLRMLAALNILRGYMSIMTGESKLYAIYDEAFTTRFGPGSFRSFIDRIRAAGLREPRHYRDLPALMVRELVRWRLTGRLDVDVQRGGVRLRPYEALPGRLIDTDYVPIREFGRFLKDYLEAQGEFAQTALAMSILCKHIGPCGEEAAKYAAALEERARVLGGSRRRLLKLAEIMESGDVAKTLQALDAEALRAAALYELVGCAIRYLRGTM